MILDVQVSGRTVAKLYREHDEYVMKYLPGAAKEDFKGSFLFAAYALNEEFQ